MPPKSESFTLSLNGLTNVLITPAIVFPAFDPKQTKPHPTGKQYNAIWDTGATNSVITVKIVRECGLKQIGITKVQGVGGVINDCPQYLVNIGLPNNVGVLAVRVTEGNLSSGIDVLIGMDIIALGDFAITNREKKTTFSFRFPSMETIDFVKQHKKDHQATPQKIGRNAPCPCGSGKKYKKCCGKQPPVPA